jgi:WS/DGAT/MGAT family acyltransferase
MPQVDRLTDEDVRILKLESGNIRGHTCKVVVLEPRTDGSAPAVDELREHVSARLDRAPRFRRRLACTPLGIANPVWIDDSGFDIANHIRPAPAGAGLREAVAGLMSQRLDRERPLWAMDVVTDLDDGATAVVWRIHHCMADGVTAVKLGSALLWDEAADADVTTSARSSWQPQDPPSGRALFASGVRHRITPRRRRKAGGPRADHRTLSRELGRKATPTPLDRRIGPARDVAFASASLQDLKRIGKSHDERITLNDVVLTVVTRGVRAWLEDRHAAEEGIRAKVPVSLHQHDEDNALGNRDSYFFVDLPVSEPDPVRCMLAINRETADRKRHHDAEALYHLGLHRSVARWAMSPHVFTFNVSNVPGPREPVFVRGAPVRSMHSLAEVAQHHALRVSVISCAGAMHFALCADRDAVPDLDTVARGLEHSIEELLALT